MAPFGIKVLIVEPGAFRTELFEAYSASQETSTYSSTVGATRTMIRSNTGKQPGDPAKAAAAILSALAADDPPLRLPLGGDAVDAVTGHLDKVRAEIAAWEDVARGTALEGEADGSRRVGGSVGRRGAGARGGTGVRRRLGLSKTRIVHDRIVHERPAFAFSSAMSWWTISSSTWGNSTFGSQPNTSRALDASPTRWSTSAGRLNRSSVAT